MTRAGYSWNYELTYDTVAFVSIMEESKTLELEMTYIDDLAHDCGNSSANALELPQSCVTP